MNQRDHDSGTTGAKRVTQGHSSTVDVDTLRVQAQFLVVGNANHTERFVQFPQVNVLLAESSFVQRFGQRQGGRRCEPFGCLGCVGSGQDFGQRL